MADFNTSAFVGLKNETLLWVVFIIVAIFLNILMLNLLIAIMSDTFARVTNVKE
jgi:hypothetical protein